MKISVAKDANPKGSSVYIFSKITDLDPLSLTDAERQYVTKSIKGKDNRILRLNRFPDYIHLVKVKASTKPVPKLQEKLRTWAIKPFAWCTPKRPK
ncbi:MAG: hypothetical protein U5L96_01235 [Owenweeksia sp.]|nr:hypothetical protein [Owenweeksia sp.]